jgi:hypothetical protein
VVLKLIVEVGLGYCIAFDFEFEFARRRGLPKRGLGTQKEAEAER